MENWYVVKTKPNQEEKVRLLLTQAKIRSFLPQFKDVIYHNARRHYRVRPFFPTYLFLNIDFFQPENVHMIKYTRGVAKILCAGDRPVPISGDVIKTIQSRADGNGLIQRQGDFRKGDRIRVKKGLLKDLIGILERPASDEERVVVLLNFINYNMKATVYWSDIEKVKVA